MRSLIAYVQVYDVGPGYQGKYTLVWHPQIILGTFVWLEKVSKKPSATNHVLVAPRSAAVGLLFLGFLHKDLLAEVLVDQGFRGQLDGHI